jgi:hypothetical protein
MLYNSEASGLVSFLVSESRRIRLLSIKAKFANTDFRWTYSTRWYISKGFGICSDDQSVTGNAGHCQILAGVTSLSRVAGRLKGFDGHVFSSRV